MLVHYKTIVIGGGAAGLFYAHLDPDCLLIEKNEVLGKKLLITGGGACNVTHDEDPRDFITHFYEKKNYVQKCIYAFGPRGILNHLQELGVDTYTREDGKVFPLSNRSESIRGAFASNLRNVLLSCPVSAVRKEGDLFLIETEKGTYSAENLVLAAGGNVFPQTGTTGDSFTFAKALGHTIIPPRNALCQIRIREDVSSLEGISLEDVTLKIGKVEMTGPMVFTRKGISGPVAQNISRYVEGETEVTIRMTEITQDAIKALNGKQRATNAIHGLTGLPTRLVENLLPLGEKNIASLTKAELNETVRLLSSWKTIGTTRDENRTAMVTKGGVDTKEVDSSTFGSRICPNLYILGEALDADGKCGGYNLPFAFSSAYMAHKATTLSKDYLDEVHVAAGTSFHALTVAYSILILHLEPVCPDFLIGFHLLDLDELCILGRQEDTLPVPDVLDVFHLLFCPRQQE
ncbi:MAG: aminoacetone oxidase family FAD-binding enzyme, partial [Spirochaetales bacterium]|nr:aminoacetone oxidase family FAD-binding enzyme [Candidatus Physcosoma equi]